MADLITDDVVNANGVGVVLRCQTSVPGHVAGETKNETTWNSTNLVVGFSPAKNVFCKLVSLCRVTLKHENVPPAEAYPL